MSRWQIRTAGETDGPELARLAGELGYPSTPAQIEARLRRVAADAEHAVFVAEAGGRIGGWVHVFINKLLESDARAEIGGLVAEPALRRQGIGRALMAAAENWTRHRAVAAITLRSNVTRADAHRFYEALGYGVAKTQLTFRKTL